jgi:predicted PurR-regulated permease PerM
MGEANITISTTTIIKTVLILVGAALLYFLQDVVLIILTSIVIASAVEPATKFFEKYRIPRMVGVLLLYVVFIGAFAGIMYYLVPPLVHDLRTISTGISTVTAPASDTGLLASLGISEDFSLDAVTDALLSQLQQLSANPWQAFSKVFGGLLTFGLILIFSFYFAVQETGVDDILRVVTPPEHQAYVQGLWKRTQDKIGKWMQGQLLLGVLIGVLTYIGLTILDVPYALMLALCAGLFELIPVFGPTLSAVPAVAVAFVHAGPTLAILVVGLYIILQQFENHLLYPLVVTKVVGVPPLLVIVGIIVGAKLAGFLGVILAVPMSALLLELVNDLQAQREGALRLKEAVVEI